MSKLYILAGPADCGNQFQSWSAALVEADCFAVVRDGEYSNGGRGPSSVDGKLYSTRERAEAALYRAEAAALA